MYSHALSKGAKMKKPKTPIYNSEDLKALLLGECPYCGGKATVTLNQKKEYTSLRDYPAGFFMIFLARIPHLLWVGRNRLSFFNSML